MNFKVNKDKKINPKFWILALLSLFGIWQMGVMFFSGTSLSLYGRTPININATYTAFFIAGGYISTILLNYFFFKKSMLMGKIALFLSLIITIMMFIPVSTAYLTILFYINAFCCTFLIGINYAIETNLLDNKSELKFVFICSLIIFSGIVLMQGDFFHLPFFVFNIISALILIALTITYFLLPRNIETYVKADIKDNTQTKTVPVLLKIGSYLAIFVSTLCLVFGSAISETVTYGVGLFYFIGIAFTILFGYLVFKKKLSPFKVYTFSFALTIVGFVFAILSMQYSWCVYPSIILIGATCLPANMIGFLTNTLFKSKPSKIYVPILAGIGFSVAVLQAGLLELFRNNLSILFSVISILAVVVLITYSSIEPSLTYHWRQISAVENEENAKTNGSYTADKLFDSLSNREHEIVNCILHGNNNSEIAKAVFLSPQTVKSYRKNIYAKLNIHSRSELFELANKTKK